MTVRHFETIRGGARPVGDYIARASYRLAILAGASVFLVAAISRPLLGAPINYGDFMGTTVTYTDVTEDANSPDDSPPLFGEPTVAGNGLDFDPVGFEASSSGAGAPDITDGQLFFGIEAKAGNAIHQLTITEAGDTTLAGFDATLATFTSVTASGVLNVYEVDGAPLPPNVGVLAVPFSLTFSPSGGNYFQSTDGGGGPFFHTQWSGQVVLNLNLALTNAGVPIVMGATRASINLDNTLVASSRDGTTTLIAKKDFGGLSITVDEPVGNIPEPATAVLACLAVAAIGAGRRRT